MNEASLMRMLAESAWIPPLLRDERIEWTEVATQTLRATCAVRVLTPWRRHLEDYEPTGGLVIPLSARVEWIPPEGQAEVWRARVTGAEFAYGNAARTADHMRFRRAV